MSRITKESSAYTVAYGKDPLDGLFIQVFEKYGNNKHEPILDMSEHSHPGLTIEKIVAIADDYNVDLSSELTEATIE